MFAFKFEDLDVLVKVCIVLFIFMLVKLCNVNAYDCLSKFIKTSENKS